MVGYGSPTRSVGDVAQVVKRQFGDESGVQVDDNDILEWVNDAQEEIVTRNKILKAKSTTPSVAGQADYNWPAVPIHQIESLHFKGQKIPNMVFAAAEEKIMAADPEKSLTGDPEFWYEWAGTFTFWPAPADVANIDIYYTAKPTKIVSTADMLGVPDKYYRDVVRYVLQQAYEMDEDWTASQTKGQQFDTSLNQMGEEERTAQNMTYDKIIVVD